jgi:tRNA 2-thiouridine synthesizing protein A
MSKKNIGKLDTTGLKCPEPVLKIAVKSADMVTGDVLEVIGDCPTFENDVRIWCKRINKTLLFVQHTELVIFSPACH